MSSLTSHYEGKPVADMPAKAQSQRAKLKV
ncbi:hypothetical protein CCACVL1_05851 [Corchorus capsularis]|uniref:Uncharacterized protein n=1 Tax=Corchorus capsularis TaxID=210143 RepID=A0A1R3JIU5_COCAP|nr:hypothetical protein CCACVL1_05851 [Corchorus capsularis]